MAYRLGDYVVYGEIYNHNHYSTHGNIALLGNTEEDVHVIHLALTGDCNPDLQGKGFRFWLHNYPKGIR